MTSVTNSYKPHEVSPSTCSRDGQRWRKQLNLLPEVITRTGTVLNIRLMRGSFWMPQITVAFLLGALYESEMKPVGKRCRKWSAIISTPAKR